MYSWFIDGEGGANGIRLLRRYYKQHHYRHQPQQPLPNCIHRVVRPQAAAAAAFTTSQQQLCLQLSTTNIRCGNASFSKPATATSNHNQQIRTLMMLPKLPKTVDRKATAEQVIHRKRTLARTLLNEQNQPVGSFMLQHFNDARTVLDVFRQQRVTDSLSINLTWQLLDRFFTEMVVTGNTLTRHYNWVRHSKLFTPLIECWAQCWRRQQQQTNDDDAVLTPMELHNLLHAMYQRQPWFDYSIESSEIIVKQQINTVTSNVNERPIVATQMFQKARHPYSTSTFNYVLQLWAETDQIDVATSEILQLVSVMDADVTIEYNKQTYTTLFTFWGRAKRVDQIDAMVSDGGKSRTVTVVMKDFKGFGKRHRDVRHRNAPLKSIDFLAAAQMGYVLAEAVTKAEDMLLRMIDSSKYPYDVDFVRGRIEDNLNHYVSILCGSNTSGYTTAAAAASLEDQRKCVLEATYKLFVKLEARGLFDCSDGNEKNQALYETCIRIFSHAKQYDLIRTTLLQMNAVSCEHFTSIVRAIGECDHSTIAEGFFHELLSRDGVHPDASTFTAMIDLLTYDKKYNTEQQQQQQQSIVLNTKAISIDVADKGLALLDLMRTHKKCVDAGLEPNLETYVAILRCLASVRYVDADFPGKDAGEITNVGTKANTILQEMEKGSNLVYIKPDHRAYIFGLRACMHVREYDVANDILQRMIKSKTANATDILNEAIAALVLDTKNTAEEMTIGAAEKILVYMVQKARQGKLAVRPNLQSYEPVLRAWSLSTVSNARERMWTVYEQLRTESDMEPSSEMIAMMLVSLVQSSRRSDVEKGWFLLQYLQTKNGRLPLPHRHVFRDVVTAWLHTHKDVESAETVLIWWLQEFLQQKEDRGTVLMVHANNFFYDIAAKQTANFALRATLLDAWEHSTLPSKETHINKLLRTY